MAREAQRTARAARVSPDRYWVAITAISLVLTIMLASFVFSFVAIMDAGRWAGVHGWVQALAPLFIDGAIVTYTLALAIYQARGAEARIRRRTRQRLWAFTLASVLLNAAHAAAHWSWDYTRMEAWFGTLIAVLAPLAALVSAEEVMHLAFTDTAATEGEGMSGGTSESVGEAPAEPPRELADRIADEGIEAVIDRMAREQDDAVAASANAAPVVVGGAFTHENAVEVRDDARL